MKAADALRMARTAGVEIALDGDDLVLEGVRGKSGNGSGVRMGPRQRSRRVPRSCSSAPMKGCASKPWTRKFWPMKLLSYGHKGFSII